MLRSDVYEQLKERLFSGELRPGQFVSQRELTSLLGATLNPVREAIRKLEAEGLINIYAQKGIQIIEGGPKSINDSYDYRLLLETAAFRHLAENGSDEELVKLRGDVQSSLDALAQNPDDRRTQVAALENDFAFHKAVVDLQNNAIISKHFSMNAARERLFRLNMGEPLRRLSTAAKEHLDILEACEKRNAERAVKLITEHVEVSRAHTLGIRPM